MKVEKESVKSGVIKLKISLDKKEWEKILDKAAEKVSADTKIEGFRPGKAPRNIVINKVGEARVLSVAIEEAVQEFYPKAAEQEEIRPVALPKVGVDKATPTDPLVFTAEVVVMPEVELEDYRKIRVKKQPIELAKPEQVDEILKSMQKRAAEFNEVERAAKMKDWVEIDFVGTIDDKEFEGGSSKNHPLILGDKLFVPGFEEGIEGMKAGENKDIEVTFPSEYHNKALAGKKASFKITLHKVKSVNYPDIDDTLAKKVSKFSTLDELKKDVARFIEEESKRKAEGQAREEAILSLAKLVKVDLPSELVDQELNAMINDMRQQVAAQKMDFNEHLKRAGVENEEGLKSQWREQAEQRVRAGLALDAFRKAESIEATDKEVDEEISKLEKMYPNDKDKIVEEYKKPVAKERLRNMIASRKAVDQLVAMAVS